MPITGPPSIDPGLISGLADPWIKHREEQELGTAVSAASEALARGDYAGMAKLMQGVAGRSPAVASMLMGQVQHARQLAQQQQQFGQTQQLTREHYGQLAKQFEEQQKLTREQMGKGAFHVDPDTGVAVEYVPGVGGAPGSMRVLGNISDLLRPAGAPPAVPTAAPVTATPTPTPATPAPATVPAAPAIPEPTTSAMPTPDEITYLRANPKYGPAYEQRYPGFKASSVISETTGGGPAAAAPSAPAKPPITLSTPPAIAVPPVPPGTPMGGAYRKAAATEAGKESVKTAATLQQEAMTAQRYAPAVRRIVDAYDKVEKAGGVGPAVGSAIGQTVTSFAGSAFPQARALALAQSQYRQAVDEMMQMLASAHKGEGAVSNYERTLYARQVPVLTELNTETAKDRLRSLAELTAETIRRGGL